MPDAACAALTRVFRLPPRFKTIAISALLIAALGGCNLSLRDSYESEYRATVGYLTEQNRALRDVPPPAKRVTVAVYGLPDLTGQDKESPNGQTLSRAVTQGGSAGLVKALQDAGERRLFSVLDRSNFDNLIRERQIITEMRRRYRDEQQINASVLGPLNHVGILIEGAILGYDTNTVTGGAGGRYLGIGANRQWKLDVITVSLRAVSTETSEVLASVVVRKPLASIRDQGSIFTYVALDEPLEAEDSRSINEPKQLAIEQAVEKGVMALIAEGAQLGVWEFADPVAGRNYIAGYTAQKFDGEVPANALTVVPPETRNAADIPGGPTLQSGRLAQSGLDHSIALDVTGRSNLFAVRQTGQANSITGTIFGTRHQASIAQAGHASVVRFSQVGVGNSFRISQLSW
ncbi:CsgG/HfaB family protein [Jannaschia seohaensis]|uniref:Curli biogenesis system outer membrane secretion channel CsgG n=1 Tax=Jannaschia seohaensis TaxID=475081 RepID=A0A2Y9B7Q6_9RHOB|nr:CsgG/HfaB family protein [Jannaschia seohaensis]PWJ14469.1 curli biogenesis system outer membrane secretion channel CsgG [Jannaschia seohaensis]SSA50219.1 Curli biogenesis system outer membrane secretion channel CsgG [Jannaschia seohaensis]